MKYLNESFFYIFEFLYKAGFWQQKGFYKVFLYGYRYI